MKVAVSCDHVLARGGQSALIARLLEAFPEAPLYTLAHRPGRVERIIEERPIFSSYLSHLTDTPEQFYKRSCLAPRAAAALPIPPEVDFLFNLTSGLSHGLPKAPHTRQISYLVDNELSRRPAGVLGAWPRRWAAKTLARVERLWVGSRSLQERHPQSELIPPPFKLQDFPLFPSAQRQLLGKDVYAVAEKGFTPALQAAMGNRQVRVIETSEHCSLPPVLNGARAFIDFSGENFPARALAALACGCPVILRNGREFLSPGEGVFFAENPAAVPELLNNLGAFDTKKLRARAAPFAEARFKGRLRRACAAPRLPGPPPPASLL